MYDIGVFTFNNVSINTDSYQTISRFSAFTFHNVSINTC